MPAEGPGVKGVAVRSQVAFLGDVEDGVVLERDNGLVDEVEAEEVVSASPFRNGLAGVFGG